MMGSDQITTPTNQSPDSSSGTTSTARIILILGLAALVVTYLLRATQVVLLEDWDDEVPEGA